MRLTISGLSVCLLLLGIGMVAIAWLPWSLALAWPAWKIWQTS